jgi:hypothetical protein
MGAMKMKTSVKRQSVDLTGYPELVVIYLGMRVNALTGLKTLLGLGPQINKAGAARPPGLLHFENKIIYSLFPSTLGCVGTGETLNRWRTGPDHPRTKSGGNRS